MGARDGARSSTCRSTVSGRRVRVLSAVLLVGATVGAAPLRALGDEPPASPDPPIAELRARTPGALANRRALPGQPDRAARAAGTAAWDGLPPVASTWWSRPRLFLRTVSAEAIAAKSSVAPWSTWWGVVESRARTFVEEEPRVDAAIDEESARQHGDRLPYLALAHLVTRDPWYLEAARDWMDRAVALPAWAGDEDLGAAHLLFGMSVCYDWLHGHLSESDRLRYRDNIARHAEILYALLAGGRKWWSRDLLQNHNYVNAMAIAVAAVALAGDADGAGRWLAAAKANFDRAAELLSPDGATHEGVAYWGYAMDAFLKYHFATLGLFKDQDLLSGPHFRNASLFRLYSALPGFRESVNYADSPTLEWYGPGYVLRGLAGGASDGLAQWLADRISKARAGKSGGLGSPLISWLDLVWYDATVQPRGPDGMPLQAYFPNLGIYVSRSDWSDAATWFFFKVGPPQGHAAAARGVLAGSHIHPDAGNFMLWADGGWVVVDDGYVTRKRTGNHNVLLFNGSGQLGEGQTWFVKAASKPGAEVARIIEVTRNGDGQTLRAEVAPAYPNDAGVRRWSRRIDIAGGDAFEITDTVALAGSGTVESLVHARGVSLHQGGEPMCLSEHSDYALVPRAGWDKVTATDYVIDPGERHKANGFYDGGLVRATRSVAAAGTEVNLGFSIVRRAECSPAVSDGHRQR